MNRGSSTPINGQIYQDYSDKRDIIVIGYIITWRAVRFLISKTLWIVQRVSTSLVRSMAYTLLFIAT